MRSIVLIALLLVAYVNANGQNNCNDRDCVSSDTPCRLPPSGHCCRISTNIAVLTATCARACAAAKATAYASVHASAGVHVHASAVACTSAQACITQSLSVSLSEGTCCKINSTIKSTAYAYATASASASASADASARAAAGASASATATADAAASLYAFAQATATSTCCNLHLSLVSQVEAVGQFVVSAQVHSQAAVALYAKARVAADACVSVSKAVRVGLDVAASVTTNNCCNSGTLSDAAQDSGRKVRFLADSLEDLHQLTNTTTYQFATAIEDADILTDPTPISSLIQESVCKDTLYSCCGNVGCCGLADYSTCGLVLQTYIAVTLEAKAIVATYAGVGALVYTSVSAFAATTVAIKVVAAAAVQASTSVTIVRESCCALKIFITLDARSAAAAFAAAFAAARAEALAYAAAYAYAEASATAIAQATASASVSAVAGFGSCCGSSCCSLVDPPGEASTCCVVSQKAKDSCSNKNLIDCANDCASCSREIFKCKDAAVALFDADYSAVLNAVSTTKLIILQCCCCTEAPATSTTAKGASSSAGTSFSIPNFTFPKKP